MLKDKQVAYTGIELSGVSTVRDALDALATGGGGAKKDIHVTLNASVTGTTASYIGAVYVDKSGYISSDCKALIGGSSPTETAILVIYPFGSLVPLTSIIITGDVQSVDFGGPTAIGIGWYDLTLAAGTLTDTAIIRGLYLHV